MILVTLTTPTLNPRDTFPVRVTQSEWFGGGPSVGAFDVGAYGVGGEGGSFFHDSTINPPGSTYPTHGPTSVAGATAGGTSGPFQLGDTTWGRTIASNYLRRMYKGLYTSPNEFGLMKQAMPSPFASQPLGSQMNPGWNWNTFHSGQTQLGDILRANPAYYQSLINACSQGRWWNSSRSNGSRMALQHLHRNDR